MQRLMPVYYWIKQLQIGSLSWYSEDLECYAKQFLKILPWIVGLIHSRICMALTYWTISYECKRVASTQLWGKDISRLSTKAYQYYQSRGGMYNHTIRNARLMASLLVDNRLHCRLSL